MNGVVMIISAVMFWFIVVPGEDLREKYYEREALTECNYQIKI
jgi:hypothetical protein